MPADHASRAATVKLVDTYSLAYSKTWSDRAPITQGDAVAVQRDAVAAGLAAVQHLHGADAVRWAAERIPEEPAGGARAWLNREADRLAAGMVTCECEPPWHFRGISRCIHRDEPAADGLSAELDRLRAENVEYAALFELGYRRTSEAQERWRAEDPEARANVLPDLGRLVEWLMADADKARATATGTVAQERTQAVTHLRDLRTQLVQAQVERDWLLAEAADEVRTRYHAAREAEQETRDAR